MVIAVLTVEYHLHGNDSLKGKRRVANSLKQKVRNTFNVAIAEYGTEDSLTRSLDINIKGYFHCAQQAALKMMRKKSGVIVNISSVSSIMAIPGQSVYSATKGAVNALTATLAKELAPYGIRVNAVAPGFVETEMLDHIPAEQKEGYLKAVPMGRFAAPSEVADAVCTLCQPELSYLTGQTLVLDGGLSL